MVQHCLVDQLVPVLHVEVVGDSSEYEDGLAQRIADAAGSSLDSRPGGTWVKVSFTPVSQYAENGSAEQGLSMLVTLTLSDVPSGQALQDRMARLTTAIADAAGHPARNVHIIIEPPARGRIIFGGELLE